MPRPFPPSPITEPSLKRSTRQNGGATHVIPEDQSNILSLPRRCLMKERLGLERKPCPITAFRPDTTYSARRLKLLLTAVRQICRSSSGTVGDESHRLVLDQEARRLIQQRNLSSIDAFVEHIELLPTCAGSNNWLFQGASDQMKIYSVRSRSHPPVKIYLWGTPDGKVMVRYKLQSMSLVRFLDKLEAPNTSIRSCSRVWRTLLEEDINFFPPHLRRNAYQRWRSFNTFPRFMELPPELQEKIIHLAVFLSPLTMPRQSCLRMPPDNYPRMDLTLVNRHIYSLTASIIYSQTTFSFGSLSDFDWFVSKVSDASRNTIRSIEISFGISEILAFLEDIYPAHRRCEGTRVRGHTGDSLRIRNLTNLRYLCINVSQHRSRWMSTACRRTFCTWVWEAAQPYIAQLPSVSFEGNFKPCVTELSCERP